jgi:hypothetical protein
VLGGDPLLITSMDGADFVNTADPLTAAWLQGLGKSVSDVCAAAGLDSQSGTTRAAVLAMRVAGVDHATLVASYRKALQDWRPPAGISKPSPFTTVTVGGKAVEETVITSRGQDLTFYLYGEADILFLVTAQEASLAAEALAYLPGVALPMSCGTGIHGAALVDDASGFRLCLPVSWRSLVPGDAGWVIVYGRGGPATTTFQDFAVPLEPPDADREVNLAVYVRPTTAGSTLAALANAYQDVLTRVKPPARDIAQTAVTLPAGAALRLTAIHTRTLGALVLDDRYDVYILVDNGRSYYLVFTSSDATRDHYAPVFLTIAESLSFLTPTPTGP